MMGGDLVHVRHDDKERGLFGLARLIHVRAQELRHCVASGSFKVPRRLPGMQRIPW